MVKINRNTYATSFVLVNGQHSASPLALMERDTAPCDEVHQIEPPLAPCVSVNS